MTKYALNIWFIYFKLTINFNKIQILLIRWPCYPHQWLNLIMKHKKYKYFETCKYKTIMKHTNLKHGNQKYFEICKSKTNVKHENVKLNWNMHIKNLLKKCIIKYLNQIDFESIWILNLNQTYKVKLYETLIYYSSKTLICSNNLHLFLPIKTQNENKMRSICFITYERLLISLNRCLLTFHEFVSNSSTPHKK